MKLDSLKEQDFPENHQILFSLRGKYEQFHKSWVRIKIQVGASKIILKNI